MKDKVCIILVNYNGAQDTLECIKSLKKIDYPHYEVVVVDNLSTDDSVSFLQKQSGITFIASPVNSGFSGGNNLGIDYALKSKFDYVLLLNNDTVVKPDFLTLLMKAMKADDQAGIVGPSMYYYPEKDIMWYGGGRILWGRYMAQHEQFQTRREDVLESDIRDISFLTGCCMLIRSELIKKIGKLDEQYFMYLEDLDYCIRTIEAGYKILYQPRSEIYHKVGISSGGEESAFALMWSTRNRLVLRRKFKHYLSKRKDLAFLIFFYISRMVKVFIFLLKRDIPRAKAIIQGLKMYKKWKEEISR